MSSESQNKHIHHLIWRKFSNYRKDWWKILKYPHLSNWPRRLVCAMRSLPLFLPSFSLSFFLSLSLSFLSVFCFWPTLGKLPCVKICFPGVFILLLKSRHQNTCLSDKIWPVYSYHRKGIDVRSKSEAFNRSKHIHLGLGDGYLWTCDWHQ